MKRIFGIALALVLTLSFAVGCTDHEPDASTESPTQAPTEPGGTSASTDSIPSETDMPTESVTETETEAPEPEPIPLELVRDGTYLYPLICPQECTASITTVFEGLRTAMIETFGTGISVSTDAVDQKVIPGEYVTDAPEILIGETNRIESREVFMSLKQGQYAIRAVGNKIVIVGYTDALTILAAETFIQDYIKTSDGKSLSILNNHSLIGEPYAQASAQDPQVKFEDITPVGDRLSAETPQWVACEIALVSAKEYADPVYTVDTDVIFRHKESGKTMSIPAFWDGGTAWKVRFAPTEIGEWEFYTICTDAENEGLHHRAGTVTCSAYTGDLDIYKHGFVSTEPGKNYFVHADGTPFFYLGDTYWTLPLLELDSYGSVETQKQAGITQEIAEANGITSQFAYIIDYRVAQGYTVAQSQPLGWWTVPGENGWFADDNGSIYTYGVNDIMLAKFQQYDRYFAYIAEKGLVHSNTQFGYPTALMTQYFAGNVTDEHLEKLCRYWVARYGAYPVMWATTQEGDNDYYGERGDCAATPETNPWLKVFAYVQKYDAYDHPATCHQEHWSYTAVNNSAFDKLDGHTWYASQYNTSSKAQPAWNLLREYWNNPGFKPVVNYEGRYDHFWTGTYGARYQGWLAFMNGQVGYGYGVQPIWSIFWSGDSSNNWTGSDERGEFKRDANWLEGLQSEAGLQVTYIKKFLSAYEWWNLAPCFDYSYFHQPSRYLSTFSHIGNDLYVGYCYGAHIAREEFGQLTAMKNGTYEVVWFNCQTGEYGDPFTVKVTDGTYRIPARPADGDFAIAVQYIGSESD